MLLGEASFIIHQTPLWAVSTDLNDPEPSCMAMSLQQQHAEGSGPTAGEHLTTEALQHYGPARYSVNRELASSFWFAWQRDYVAQLLVRCKWIKSKRNLQVCDLVIMRDKSLQCNQ